MGKLSTSWKFGAVWTEFQANFDYFILFTPQRRKQNLKNKWMVGILFAECIINFKWAFRIPYTNLYVKSLIYIYKSVSQTSIIMVLLFLSDGGTVST